MLPPLLQRLAQGGGVLREGAASGLALHALGEHLRRGDDADDGAAGLGHRTVLRPQQRAAAQGDDRVGALVAESPERLGLGVPEGFAPRLRHVFRDGHPHALLHQRVQIDGRLAKRHGQVACAGGLARRGRAVKEEGGGCQRNHKASSSCSGRVSASKAWAWRAAASPPPSIRASSAVRASGASRSMRVTVRPPSTDLLTRKWVCP